MLGKLEVLTQKLKRWNIEDYGIVEGRHKIDLKKLREWDVVQAQRPLSQRELELKLSEAEEFKKWSFYKEIVQRQKSRELWLKEGDRKTKFFHKLANSHRRNNAISKLKINGQWVMGSELKQGISSAFQVFCLTLEIGWQTVTIWSSQG